MPHGHPLLKVDGTQEKPSRVPACFPFKQRKRSVDVERRTGYDRPMRLRTTTFYRYDPVGEQSGPLGHSALGLLLDLVCRSRGKGAGVDEPARFAGHVSPGRPQLRPSPEGVRALRLGESLQPGTPFIVDAVGLEVARPPSWAKSQKVVPRQGHSNPLEGRLRAGLEGRCGWRPPARRSLCYRSNSWAQDQAITHSLARV